MSSILYQGNVTYRVDPTWGVSGNSKMTRSNSTRLSLPIQSTPSNAYDRCKVTRRCSHGSSEYLQSSASLISTMQHFVGGEHINIPLFADFEDWRQGTFGWWGQSCEWESSRHDLCDTESTKIDDSIPTPKGAHFFPFDFDSLGPSIPSFKSSFNNGLVLNRARLKETIKKQSAYVASIEDYLTRIDSDMTISSLSAKARARKDIHLEMIRTKVDYEDLLGRETEKLVTLSSSQCQNVSCSLLFNTSNLELIGAINATGTLSMTPDGTEVAIWSFDSIDLGSEVNVTLTGQRAIALLSKSSAYIDTIFYVHPGTLGGFPGGYSVFRDKRDRFTGVCPQGLKDMQRKEEMTTAISCNGDQPLSRLNMTTKSNNINGPGSSSVRIYLHV